MNGINGISGATATPLSSVGGGDKSIEKKAEMFDAMMAGNGGGAQSGGGAKSGCGCKACAG